MQASPSNARRHVASAFERLRIRSLARARLLGTVVEPVRFGRYVVHEKIAHGAASVVYGAHDPSLGRDVALKLLLEGEADAQRLFAEARALARLSHPNVLPIYDVGLHEGVPYLVVERVHGGTLRRRLSGPIEAAEALALVRAIGAGLAEAHRLGFVHRDLKPENVLLAGAIPKIADFGTVTRFDGALVEGNDFFPGTPAYMAPEQRDGRFVDPRSDQYAFGLLAHEVAFGAHPLVDERGRARPARHVPPPSHPLAWAAPVFARASSDRPEARFPSVDAMLAAITQADPARRRRVFAAVGVATALVLGAVGLVAFAYFTRDTTVTDEMQLFHDVGPMLLAQRWSDCDAYLAPRVETPTLAATYVQCADLSDDPARLDRACERAHRIAPDVPFVECDPLRRVARRYAGEGRNEECVQAILREAPSRSRVVVLSDCAARLGHVHDREICLYMRRLDGDPTPEHTCGDVTPIDSLP